MLEDEQSPGVSKTQQTAKVTIKKSYKKGTSSKLCINLATKAKGLLTGSFRSLFPVGLFSRKRMVL